MRQHQGEIYRIRRFAAIVGPEMRPQHTGSSKLWHRHRVPPRFEAAQAGPPRSGGYTPGDRVVRQRNESVLFPRTTKGQRGRVRGVGGPGRADRGVAAMAETKIGHAAFADRTRIAEHTGPAIGLQRGV